MLSIYYFVSFQPGKFYLHINLHNIWIEPKHTKSFKHTIQMKKLILSIVFLSLLVLQGQSQRRFSKEQSFFIGPKFSTGFITTAQEHSLIGNENDYVVHDIMYNKSSPMYSGGLFMQKNAGFLFYQANLAYTYFKSSYDVISYDNRNFSPVMDEQFHYIDLSISGGLRINKFRIGVGPVIHFLAASDSELEVIPEYNSKFKSTTFGFISGIGYDFGNIFIDLKYENSFRSIGDHIYYGPRKSAFKGSPNNFSVHIAYGF